MSDPMTGARLAEIGRLYGMTPWVKELLAEVRRLKADQVAENKRVGIALSKRDRTEDELRAALEREATAVEYVVSTLGRPDGDGDCRVCGAPSDQSHGDGCDVACLRAALQSVAHLRKRWRAMTVEQLRDRATRIAMGRGFGAAEARIVELLRAVAGDLEKLRQFAQAILADWPDSFPDGCIGGQLQESALAAGLLFPVVVQGSCGENCACAEWGEFPQTCYRRTALLTGVSDEKTE